MRNTKALPIIGVALFQTLAIATAVGAGNSRRAPLAHKA